MKSLSESEVTYSFPKNVKFHSCLVFWANLWFYQQFHCKIYVWRWCEPNLIFFLVISKTLSFQMKKKNQIPKILPMWVFVALRHQQNFEILHLLSSLILTKFWTKCLMPDFCPNNSIPHIFYGNNHFDIHLIAIKP